MKLKPKFSSIPKLWILMGTVLVLFLIPFLIGLFLPNHYEATVRVTLEREPAEIWARIVNHEEHPLSSGRSPQIFAFPEAEEQPAWIEELNQSRMEVRTLESEEPRRLVLATSTTQFVVKATWTINLEPREGGTAVTVTHVLDVESSTWDTPYFRFLLRLSGAAQRAPALFLQSIATALESDAVVEPVMLQAS